MAPMSTILCQFARDAFARAYGNDPLSRTVDCMGQDIRFRAGRKSDLPLFADCDRRLFVAEGPWTLADYRADFRSDGSFYVVAEVDGRLAGFLGASAATAEGVVTSLLVEPEFQGRGVGRALLIFGVDRLLELGAERVVLQVRVGNDSAISLYEGLGFRSVERLEGFYRSGVDAWLMTLDEGVYRERTALVSP